MKSQETILLQSFDFSKEAISFIAKNRIAYLPALATLANLAAKVIDNSYYELKSDLVDEIAEVAHAQGWRTFETYDNLVENHPYIFYVDSGRFAQMSFHSSYSRITTTTKGKWSGVSVQENAPTLIANRLKKDGFKGSVWDLVQITLNSMYRANVAEAAHLYKGINYLFVATNELVVLQNNTVVNPTDSLLQSFVTRLKGQKNNSPSSSQNEKGEKNSCNNQDKGEQQGNTEQTNSTQQGTDEGSADSQNCGTNGGKTPLTQNSQSQEEGVNEYSSQVNSGELGELFTEDNGIAKQSPEEFANGGNNLVNSSLGTDNLHELQDDLGYEQPQKEVLGAWQSMNSNTSKNSAMQVSGDDSTGFFDLLKSLNPKSKGGGGGGAQLNVNHYQAKAKVSHLVQEALQKLAGGKSLSQKQDGLLSYCGKKIVKALATAPHKLVTAKYDRPTDKVYFFVDTSGSVAEFGEFIISMIKSAQQAENIIVWSGSEAHPEKNEKNASEKEIPYIHDFADNLQVWINRVQPQIGSTLVFWGDLCDANIDSVKLKKVCQNYKCVWLHCIDKTDTMQYNYSEAEKIKAAGFTLVRSVIDEKSLAKGINSLL